MDPRKHIDVGVDRSRREVTVAGEVDFETRAEVTAAAAELNEAERGDISLDLDDVTFIDASGVGAVIEIDAVQSRRDTSLHVWSGNSFVQRVFSLCGLTALLGRTRAHRKSAELP